MPQLDSQAIHFNQVNYGIKDVQILHHITGSFQEGEITTLVGPSGAGKTTVFRLCNGLQSPNSGDIYIHGKHINDHHPIDLRRNVGMALQDATMVPGSIRKNLALPRTLHGNELSDDEAMKLLTMVGLEKDYLNRNSKELSGGQRQKLSIARTLVNQPKILLLDEITSSLDRVSQRDIEELIIHINQEYGTTIIWITHNLKQAKTIGNYTWVMMDGELVESGSENILEDTSNERVKRFVKGEAE